MNSSKLNEFLQSLMKGLTAKVFRTYNASNTLQNELAGIQGISPSSLLEKKISCYNEANK